MATSMATPGGYGYNDNLQEDLELDNPTSIYDPEETLLIDQKPPKQPGWQIPQTWSPGRWVAWWFCAFIVAGILIASAVVTISLLVNKVKNADVSLRDIPIVSTKGELAWISIGQFATGFLAIGQFALGVFTIGQCTLGLINISAVGIGVLASIGMVTASCGFVVAMLSISGYTIASMLSVSLFRVRHVMVGIHILYPFYGDDDSMFVCLGRNCNNSQPELVQYDYAIGTDNDGSVHSAPTYVVTFNPGQTNFGGPSINTTHHAPVYNPTTDPNNPLNPNNPFGYVQTANRQATQRIHENNQRLHNQLHQNNMNQMHNQIHQNNMNQIHRQNQINHQNNMNRRFH